MNSNIYDRKKHSYKNRPYYCPINSTWIYPYMYMNPYTGGYMINPYMNPYMDPYMSSCMTPSYHGNMCSCNDRAQCEATRAYNENTYNFTKENIYRNQYEEENDKKYWEEDSVEDILTFNENAKNKDEHIEKEERLDKVKEDISDSNLHSNFTEKQGMQLKEEIDKSKEKELYRAIKINMRKVPLKEITD